jgi:hypothetical protein
MADMRLIVAQIGAHHGYAVPALREQTGKLEHFYTDICGDLSWGRQMTRARCVPGLRSQLSVAARKRACDYTWERYGERLAGALTRLARL